MAAAFRPDLVVLDRVFDGAVVGADLARRLTDEADPLLLFVTGDTRATDPDGRLRGGFR